MYDLSEAHILAIARICHEANREVQAHNGEQVDPIWLRAEDWKRESAIDGVRAIVSGRVEIPKDSHENWLRHKKADGWVWGEVKDPEAKTHPCMVPYDELPQKQRVKDAVFFNIVHTLASAFAGETA